jgi:dihydrofolate synthase/folylpolyglutamate synthase
MAMPKSVGGYQSALRFILSRELFGMKLGLENISAFLNILGDPQKEFKSVHIAGTNGKGSTAAYLDSIFREAGYRTGIFTSPHLVDFRERIKIDGCFIDKRYITDFISRHRQIIVRNKLTFFEVCTAMAFGYFASRKVDIAIIETGLGGRLDATNTLLPLLTIITDISYDHTHILGNTLSKIAFEKAGIIKEKTPVLTGILPPAALRTIATVSRRRGAPLSSLKKNNFKESGRRFKFTYRHRAITLKNLESSLPGHHQIINAALAIRAIEILKESGYSINQKNIRRGLKNTHWPGRFQILKMKGKPTVILDVGHNPAGVRAMVESFRALYPGRRADMVIGLVKNKDLKKSVAHIGAIAGKIEVARLDTYRSADPRDIAGFLRMDAERISISPSVTASARRLINSAATDDIIIICGSHYGVGEFLARQKELYER